MSIPSSIYNQESPMLYDLRGHVHIENLGFWPRKTLEEKLVDIATIIIGHITYKEQAWAGGAAYVAYHLGRDMAIQWQKERSADSARRFDYANLLSGYTIKSLIPAHLITARGNIEGNWTSSIENGLMDSECYTKVYYELRYIFSTAVHEDRHIYEQHLYKGHDFYIGQRIKLSMISILTSAKNCQDFNADDAWIILNSDK